MYVTINNLGTSKDTIKKMNRNAADWEKIFASHISRKGLISRNIKNTQSSIKRKQAPQIKNGPRSEQIPHERKQMGSKEAHEKVLNLISHQGNAS